LTHYPGRPLRHALKYSPSSCFFIAQIHLPPGRSLRRVTFSLSARPARRASGQHWLIDWRVFVIVREKTAAGGGRPGWFSSPVSTSSMGKRSCGGRVGATVFSIRHHLWTKGSSMTLRAERCGALQRFAKKSGQRPRVALARRNPLIVGPSSVLAPGRDVKGETRSGASAYKPRANGRRLAPATVGGEPSSMKPLGGYSGEGRGGRA